MGAIGGLLGLNGGFNGTGANVLNPQALQQIASQGQVQGAQAGTQGALGSQQALLQALQAQNGVGNQSQVYNQLQGVANGTGPNPAQAMLNQSTGANVANQAALMAGQRGAGANVGLIARQAAQQGANTQQQAAGQAATMQANQSLNAINSAGNIAGQQVANQLGATQANTSANLENQNSLQGALQSQNANNVALSGAQAGLANTTMQGQQGLIGGLLGAGGSAAGLAKAEGGTISTYASGGDVSQPQSDLGKYFASMGGGNSGAQALQSGVSSLGAGLGKLFSGSPQSAPVAGFQQPQLGSQFSTPGPSLGVNTQLPSSQFSGGGNVGSKLKSGGGVPGKAKVAGNSYANDNVKAVLSPGEGVIDRETMGAPGAVGDAARFVMAYVNKKKSAK